VLTGAGGMIGEEGVTRTGLEPEGQVLVRGEIWDAVASASVPPGARVRVKARCRPEAARGTNSIDSRE